MVQNGLKLIVFIIISGDLIRHVIDNIIGTVKWVIGLCECSVVLGRRMFILIVGINIFYFYLSLADLRGLKWAEQ